MAEEGASKGLGTSSPTVEAQAETAITLAGRHRPVVISVKEKKKKKRKYSKGLKDLQISARKGTRIGDKFANALADGFRKFRKKSDKSSEKKRDGVLRDFYANAASGVGTTLRKSSKVPVLMAKTVRKRTMRRSVRAMGQLMRGFMR
jgi:hypothetical protein